MSTLNMIETLVLILIFISIPLSLLAFIVKTYDL